jgi:hypothetical protein
MHMPGISIYLEFPAFIDEKKIEAPSCAGSLGRVFTALNPHEIRKCPPLLAVLKFRTLLKHRHHKTFKQVHK